MPLLPTRPANGSGKDYRTRGYTHIHIPIWCFNQYTKNSYMLAFRGPLMIAHMHPPTQTHTVLQHWMPEELEEAVWRLEASNSKYNHRSPQRHYVSHQEMVPWYDNNTKRPYWFPLSRFRLARTVFMYSEPARCVSTERIRIGICTRFMCRNWWRWQEHPITSASPQGLRHPFHLVDLTHFHTLDGGMPLGLLCHYQVTNDLASGCYIKTECVFSKLRGIDPASVGQGWRNLDKVEQRYQHTQKNTFSVRVLATPV